MKTDITFRGIPGDSRADIRESLKTLARRHLYPHLEAFQASQLRLHAMIEKRKRDYRVTCQLHVPPRKILVAQATDEQLGTALHEVVDEIARQAERHRSRIRAKAHWKRKSRRERLRALKAQAGSVVQQAEQTGTSLHTLLPRLESYIRQELTYLRASDELPESYPTIADIRDEMFVRLAGNEVQATSDEATLFHMALKVITEILDEETEYWRQALQQTSLESAPEKDAVEQAEDMVEEEQGEFYQPDEKLRIEDLLVDTEVETPEQILETQSLEDGFRLLGHLPTRWRRAVMLVYRQQITPRVVATEILGLDGDELDRILEQSEAFLQAHLLERGKGPSTLSALLSPRGRG